MKISEVMRQKAKGERDAVGDLWGDHNCTTAADTIDALVAALDMVATSGLFACYDDRGWDTINDALALARGGR